MDKNKKATDKSTDKSATNNVNKPNAEFANDMDANANKANNCR